MKKKFLLVGIAITAIALLFASVFAISNWHCCISPSCTECQHEMLGCNCELKEKLGMKVCDECAAHGCGMHSGTEEMNEKMHSGVVACNGH